MERQGIRETYRTSSTSPGQDKTQKTLQPNHTGKIAKATPSKIPRAEDDTCIDINTETATRLFQIYFLSIHPIWPILYKPLYTALTYPELERRLPKSLLLAIFAISSCLDHDPDGPEIADRVTHANHASEKNQNYLVEAALRELGCDQHSSDFTFRTALEPSIASCQTLALLALQQHGAGQFSRAGILCSLAASMALELRLHLDNPDDNPVAKEISSRLWWNIFVLEKMISFEMGRPVLLRSEEVGTPYPSLFESDEYEPFTPPWNVWHSSSDSPRSHPTMKTHTISAFHTSIDLVKQMERISREVYSFAARSALTQDRALGDLTRILLWEALQDWERKFARSKAAFNMQEGASLPVSITNYVILKSTTILLHRPFVSYWQQCLETSGVNPFDTAHPLEVCADAAKAICRVLEVHSKCLQHLPCDLIFSIFIAAATLYRTKSIDPDPSTNQRCLNLCVYWLSIFRSSWENATARQMLLNDYQAYLAQNPFSDEYGIGPKPASSTKTNGEGSQISNTQLSGAGRDPSAIFPQQGYTEDASLTTSGSVDMVELRHFDMETDWQFLDELVANADEFYAMDVAFRGRFGGLMGMRMTVCIDLLVEHGHGGLIVRPGPGCWPILLKHL